MSPTDTGIAAGQASFTFGHKRAEGCQVWGTGAFEGDEQEAFAERLCRPLLRSVEGVLGSPASLPRRHPKTIDLLLCRMEALAALMELVSRGNRQYPAYGPGRLFPCELPSPDRLAKWRSDFFAEWDSQAVGWETSAAFQRARRRKFEAAFDRLVALAAAQERQCRRAAR